MNVAHGGRRRLVRRVGLAASLGLAGITLAGCSLTDFNNPVLRAGWPEGITPQARRNQELWTWSIVAAMAMGILVWGLVFWTVMFHRKKKDSPQFPRQTQYNVPLELVYTAFPFIAIAVLFFFTVQAQNFITKNPAEPTDSDVTVDVTAFQWNWQFGYGHSDVAGQSFPELDSARHPRGEGQPGEDQIDEDRVEGQLKQREYRGYMWDDAVETVGSTTEVPVLVLPTDHSVSFTLASRDVVHSFWVPQFLFKRDVFPYPKKNQTDNVFTVTQIDHPGAFVGHCAEMCGTYHAMMNFEIRALPPAQYNEYMRYRVDNPQATNSEALSYLQQNDPWCDDPANTSRGESLCSPESISTHPFKQRYNQAAPSLGTGR